MPTELARPVRRERPRWVTYVPGLLVVAGGVGVAFLVNRLVPVASALTVAVVLGAVLRNAGLVPPAALPGTHLATRKLLRTGVVLLGLQLAVTEVLRLPRGVLVVVLLTVVGTFAATLAVGRLLGVRRGTTLLVATGFSICGASAAAAMDAVSASGSPTHPRLRDEQDLATAVALVTIFGGVALLVLPLLYDPLGLDATAAGTWAGASVHEVAQVVAAASPAGAAALSVAVVVKLTRVVLLAPLVAGYSVLHRRSVEGRKPPVVPLFVVGFVAMVAVRSTGLLPEAVLEAAQVVTTLLLAGALFGLGTGVHIRSLVRTGGRAFVLGVVSTVVAAGVSLAGVLALG